MYLTNICYLLVFVCAGCVKLCAQTGANGQLPFKGITYDVYVIKANAANLKKFSVQQNPAMLQHTTFLQQLIASGDSSFFLINAGVSGANCVPEGLLVKNGFEINAINIGNGAGNFYIKPNGVLLMTESDVAIVESSQAPKYKNVVLAIQSGPLLLDTGIINPKLTQGSKNKNIRCGVGLYKKNKDTYLVFAVANQPVNFYDFATLFKEYYTCRQALCLESAGCGVYIPDINRQSNITNLVICNYLHYNE